MLLTSVVLAGLVWEFGFTSRTRGELDQLVEAQQGARAAVSAITQELRQAGACLPRTGDLVALDGEDNGTSDELIMRIGRVRPEDLVCIRTVLTADANEGESTVEVQDTEGFEVGDLVYLRGSSGSGETYGIASVSDDSITLDAPLETNHTTGDGFYAIEERSYALDDSVDPPILTLSVDGEDPQPMVHGVEEFNVQYVTTPCPPCDVLDEPADDDEWLLVREVAIEVTVRSRERNRGGEYVRLSTRSNIKPRNLL